MNYNSASLFDIHEASDMERTIAVFQKGQWTYGQLLDKIDRLNSYLNASDVEIGKRVIISSRDDQAKILFFLYCLRKGAIPVLLHQDTNMRRVDKIMNDTNPSLIVVDAKLEKRWNIEKKEGQRVVSLIDMDDRHEGNLLGKLLKKKAAASTDDNQASISLDRMLDKAIPSKNYPTSMDPSQIAYILYTSGTTDHPKGVIITHGNLMAHLHTLSQVYQLNQASNILNILALEHADGMIAGPLLALYTRSALIRPLTFEISKIPRLLTAIYKHRVSHFIAVPAMLSLIYNFAEDTYDDSFENPEFRMVISVSSHIEEKLWENFSNRFDVRIVNVYGLTETVSGSFFCGPHADSFKLGTIGKPVDAQAKIVDEKFEEVDAHMEGELVLQGAHISPGYYKNEPATREAFKDNWFLTGDVAVKDEEGFYKIVGRKKNLVIAGGYNIHPEEVNEIIMSHEGVLESCCLGLPDPVFGDRLVAVAVPASPKVDQFALAEFCKQNMEAHKVPTKFYFMEGLPKGISGKVNVPKVRELIIQENTKESADEGREQQVRKIASETFNVPMEKIHMGSTSQNVEGWDSLAHLDLITRVEKEFNTTFSTSEIITMNSIKRILSILKEK